jgi:hypothetical protein
MHLPEFVLLVLATIAAIAAGLAVLASKYSIARVLFWIAGVSFWSLGVLWSVSSEGYSLPTQLIVSGVVGAIAAVGLTWALWEIREKEKSEKPQVRESLFQDAAAQTNAQRGPTLEATGGGRINAQDATIPGDLPFQFGKADTGGIIDMPGINVTRQSDGSFSIQSSGKPINRGFPAPTGEFRSFTDAELRQRAKAIAYDLRSFQKRFWAELQALPRDSKTGIDENIARPFSETWKLEYETKHINEAHSLVSEYLARGHAVKPSNDMESTGGLMLFYKSFAGPDAALRVAAFLDRLAGERQN